MPGRGPAPKPASQRRNANPKVRGEWIDLTEPVGKVPKLPNRGRGRGHWSARTRRAWKAWWSDPASTQWGPADIDLVEHLADVMEAWVRDSRINAASEIRQLRDHLGLTPKGRQDRRWRLPGAADVVEMPKQTASERMKRLRERAAAS